MLMLVSRVKGLFDEVLRNPSSNFPPISFATALSPVSSAPSPSSPSYGVQEIIRDMRTLLGIPKYRTSKPKKVTRKFTYTRVLSPVENLVSCQSCGSFHEADTICGNCYSKVRELTNAIKQKMMGYNPYKGDRNDKQVFVKFTDDQLEDGIMAEKRVLEMDRESPTWFKKITRQ